MSEEQGRGTTGIAGQTVIPAWVIDEVLPDLRDTELRVLLVVLRQTWGRGKEWDWLSHSQLKKRTGRASEAVSGAIDTLVRRGLIQVSRGDGVREGASGQVEERFLSTAAERRRAGHFGAKLLFAPGCIFGPLDRGGSMGKSKTTEVISSKFCPFRFPESADTCSDAMTTLNERTPIALPLRDQIRQTLSRIVRS